MRALAVRAQCSGGAPTQLLTGCPLSTHPPLCQWYLRKIPLQLSWAGSPGKSPGYKRAIEIALTLDKQVGGMDSLPLDAVGATGVGTSVLPADRCHCETAITHLGPRRDGAQRLPSAPTNAILRQRRCLMFYLPPITQTQPICLPLHRRPLWRRGDRQRKGGQGGARAVAPL